MCAVQKIKTNKIKQNSGTGTFSNRNKNKQQGDAREKVPQYNTLF